MRKFLHLGYSAARIMGADYHGGSGGDRMSDKNKAWDRQTKPSKGQPHGWIQWKGTNVCMDIHCECGHHSHIDADFAYYVKCPACQKVYMVNGHVELVPLLPGEEPGMEPLMEEVNEDDEK